MSLVESFGWWTTIFWIALGVLFATIICALLCRRGSEFVAAAATPEPDRHDQLEGIEGIGSKIAAILRAAKILTFENLAECSAERLRGILRDAGGPPETGPAEPASWPIQAKLLSVGNIETFLVLVERLDDGRVPLEAIRGIGSERFYEKRDSSPIAEALRSSAIGVHSVQALAAQREHVGTLRGKLESFGLKGVDVKDIENWIIQAEAYEAGDELAYLRLAGQDSSEPKQLVDRPYPLQRSYGKAVPVLIAAGAGASHKAGCRICKWLAALFGLLAALLLLMWLLGYRPMWCNCSRGGEVCLPSNECTPKVDICRAPLQCVKPGPVETPTSCAPLKLQFPAITFKFDKFDEAGLTASGRFAIEQLESLLRQNPPNSLYIVGTADRSGRRDNHEHNRMLAEKRTSTVETMLQTSTAIPSSAITSAPQDQEEESDYTRACKLNEKTARAETRHDQHCLTPDRHVTVTATFATAASAAPAASGK